MIQQFDSSIDELKAFEVWEQLVQRTKDDVAEYNSGLEQTLSWARMLIECDATILTSIFWSVDYAVEAFAEYVDGIRNLATIDAVINFIVNATQNGGVTIAKPYPMSLLVTAHLGETNIWWNRDNLKNLPTNDNPQLFARDNSEDGNPGFVFEISGFGMNTADLDKLLKLITHPGLFYQLQII